MKILSIYLLLTILLTPLPQQPTHHKFYLSVTQIQQIHSSLYVTSHVFWDDLEIELSDFFQKKITIEDPQISTYVQEYLKKYFLLYEKNKLLHFEWIGMNVTVDKAEISFLYHNIKKTQNLSLLNQLMFRKFPEQKNMTHLITSDKKRYTLLHKVGDGIKKWQ